MANWVTTYVNYGLWRGNAKLAGQVQWDLVLDNPSNGLIISEFHLMPVSNIYYNPQTTEILLNYTHQYNLKTFYNELQGNFYQSNINPEFNILWPTISDSIYDNRNTDFDYGLKRDKYELYNKQFKFFIPIWIEQLTDVLKFKFNLLDSNNNIIASKWLILNPVSTNNKIHSKFSEYFNNWINYIGIDNGCFDTLFINTNAFQGAVHGIEITSGNIATRDISNTVYTLLTRERPLMEVDNILINAYSDNLLICKNLFQFCFHFNLEDLIGSTLAHQYYGLPIKISVIPYIGTNELEMRTFWSNYEYIPKDIVINKTDSDIISLDLTVNLKDTTTNASIELGTNTVYTLIQAIADEEVEVTLESGNWSSTYNNTTQSTINDIDLNVFDYLKDNKALELVPKNKFTQDIIHWALRFAPDFCFNLYEGFAGIYLYQLSNSAYIMSHQYGTIPNLYSLPWAETLNNDAWCHRIGKDCTCTSLDDWYNEVFNNSEIMYTDFSESNVINNIIYNTTANIICVTYKATFEEFNSEATITDSSDTPINVSIDSTDTFYYTGTYISSVSFNYLHTYTDYSLWYCNIDNISEKPVFVFLKLTENISISYPTIYEIYSNVNTSSAQSLSTNDTFSAIYNNTTYSSGDTINITFNYQGLDTNTNTTPALLYVTSESYWGIDSINLLTSNLQILYNLFANIIFPFNITYTNTLLDVHSDSPNQKTTEIDWYKYDSISIIQYIWRNIGVLRPYFIEVQSQETIDSADTSTLFSNYEKIPGNKINRLYYKDIVTSDYLTVGSNKYSILAKRGFLPIFPSIGYTSIKYTYEILDSLTEEYSGNTWNITKEWQDCIYKNIGHILCLPSTFTQIYENSAELEIENLALTALKDYIKNPTEIDDDIWYAYILSLYNYEVNWEYSSITNINTYTYTIKLTLK